MTSIRRALITNSLIIIHPTVMYYIGCQVTWKPARRHPSREGRNCSPTTACISSPINSQAFSGCCDQQLAKNYYQRTTAGKRWACLFEKGPLARTSPRAVGVAEFRFLTGHDYLQAHLYWIWVEIQISDHCVKEAARTLITNFNDQQPLRTIMSARENISLTWLLVCMWSNVCVWLMAFQPSTTGVGLKNNKVF